MDLWRLITNDHANVTELGRDVLRTMGRNGVGSRESLFDQLDGELRRHMEAIEESLYDALEDHKRTKKLVDELEDEQEEIERQLSALARSRNKGSRDWTQRFEDFTYLVDRHFQREEQELLPAARDILQPDEVEEIRQDFMEEKIKALRAERRGAWAGLSSGVVVGALAAAAAGALAVIAWRNGSLQALSRSQAGRRSLRGSHG